jgi:hypothetical protein
MLVAMPPEFPLSALLPRLVLLVLLGVLPGWTVEAEWQWTATADGIVSAETNDHPRAFLWIPPGCQRLRGVVVGQHNMEEEPILEHPHFRAALAELDLAAVWITPSLDTGFHFDRGIGDHLTALLAALGERSGYTELATVPLVPIGHSAQASYPWNYAAWNPARTLAVLSVSGQWPYTRGTDGPDWGPRTIDGIPGLVSMGEYEWAEENAAKGLAQRTAHPQMPLSMLAEPAAGHFAPTTAKIDFLALYLRKAIAYRLDPQGALRPINPTTQGWLIDRWRCNHEPRAKAAPVASYTGDPSEAFWCFDAEHALATERFQARFRNQQGQLLGYIQDGAVVPQVQGTHQQVTLAWKPLADGSSFRLEGTFLATVPAGRPERWVGLPAGSPIQHAEAGGPVTIERICGPMIQTGDNTFAIHFTRQGTTNSRRSNELWFVARHPGDERFKPAEQQAVLHFPLRNTAGAAQHLTFPELPDQHPGAPEILLAATSDAGLPVGYYILAGPAVLDGNRLRLTAIPPRSRFPVTVTVVAWQWGRARNPQVQTATPVERTFRILP